MTLVKHSARLNGRPCKCHAGQHPYGPTDPNADRKTYPMYWAHDTDVPTGSVCTDCHVDGKFVLIDADETTRRATAGDAIAAEHRHTGASSTAAPTPAQPVPVEAPPAVPASPVQIPAPAGDQTTQALAALQSLLAPKIDVAEIERIVKAELQNIAFPTRTVVITEAETREVEGTTHSKLADVVLDLSISENVLMVGPAGTGKSTIARQAAEALGLPYGEISLNPGLTATALLGYMNASGEYVKTVFREIWEVGGVFHADEFDNGHPSTLATLNAALAAQAGVAIAFPDGMVARSDDFRFVASANTFGRGPDRMYVGRQQLDAATLDRFVVEEIHVDESMEHAVCLSTGLDSPKVSEVLRYVRQLRNNAERHKMALVFSPRASIGMCRLLKAGKPVSAAIESRVRKGISDSDWSKLTDGVSKPSV